MAKAKDEEFKRYWASDDIPTADYISVGECEGCGGGVVLFLDEDDNVIARAHFPVGENWLEDEFIPALRAANRPGSVH